MSSQQPNPTIAYIRFADWCLHFDSLSEEAKHTVKVLLRKAGTSNCYEAERRLSTVEPIYLLKMTCPSTGFIHALRVPPDVRSAQEAIRWVNWDIDPTQFSVQT